MKGDDGAIISQASEKDDTRITEKVKDGALGAKIFDEEVGQRVGYLILFQETASLAVILGERPCPVTVMPRSEVGTNLIVRPTVGTFF